MNQQDKNKYNVTEQMVEVAVENLARRDALAKNAEFGTVEEGKLIELFNTQHQIVDLLRALREEQRKIGKVEKTMELIGLNLSRIESELANTDPKSIEETIWGGLYVTQSEAWNLLKKIQEEQNA